MKILTIDKEEFQRGITIDNEDDDGGISPLSYGLNHILSKGITLTPIADYLATSSNPTSDIVDSCIDPSYLGDDAFFVSSDGKFYILDNGTLTLKQTDSVKTYTYGNSRIITFKGSTFCTSTTDITLLNPTMSTIDVTWWTATLGKSALNQYYRHPMAVVEDTLYIADKNMIHTWDGTNGVYNAMTLPSSYNITELCISTDGRHLMVFCSETANYSHHKKTNARLFIVDTVTLEFIQELKVADQTESAVNVGGITYVIYGKSFGYFTGRGYKFLCHLDIANPVYSSRVAVIDNILIIAEDSKLLAYGDVNGKGNIFFYIARSQSPYNIIRNIISFGVTGVDDNKLAVNFVDSASNYVLHTLDLDSRGTGNIDVLTKKYRKGKVWIRRIDVETETLASGDSLAISIVNADGTYNQIGTFSYALNGAVQTGRFECNQLVDFIQLRLQWANFAIKSIKIYYESGE